MLVAGILGGGAVSFSFPVFRFLYLAGLLVYFGTALVSAAITTRSPILTPVVAAGIVATHLVYGVWFVIGLLSPRLKEERG
jgi:hypothetical protein